VVGFIDAHTPDPPSGFAVAGRLISHARYPTVSNATAGESHGVNPAVPRAPAVDGLVDARVRKSVVQVDADGCRIPFSGTGWVAAPHLVVTSAHVVAGAERTAVLTEGGNKRDATVVVFDAHRDLAVLYVPELEAPALPLRQPSRVQAAIIYGHPYAGPLRSTSAIVLGTAEFRIRNLYGKWTTRDLTYIAAAVQPGDSGGPLVGPTGDVVGVVFAKRGGIGYAITTEDVEAVLTAPRHAGVRSACIR
jgi:S1-C subfamily serine protease